MKHTKLALLLVPLLLVAAVFFAGDAKAKPAATPHYSVLGEAPTQTHDVVSAVDSTGITTAPLTGLYKPTHGNPKVTAKVEFTVSAATAVLACHLWFYDASAEEWTHLGKTHSSTITADNLEGAVGYYDAVAMPEFDTRGATHYEIRVDTLSAGGVSVTPYAYGSATGRE